jgi:hypothetical protein
LDLVRGVAWRGLAGGRCPSSPERGARGAKLVECGEGDSFSSRWPRPSEAVRVALVTPLHDSPRAMARCQLLRLHRVVEAEAKRPDRKVYTLP